SGREEPAGNLEVFLGHLQVDKTLDLAGDRNLNITRERQHELEHIEKIVECLDARLSQRPEILAEIRTVAVQHGRAAGHPLACRLAHRVRIQGQELPAPDGFFPVRGSGGLTWEVAECPRYPLREEVTGPPAVITSSGSIPAVAPTRLRRKLQDLVFDSDPVPSDLGTGFQAHVERPIVPEALESKHHAIFID